MYKKLFILGVLAIVCVLIYVFSQLGSDKAYMIKNRALQVVIIAVVGGCIAVSTIIFQTITNNKILTPSIMGLDSLYVMIQALLVFVLGSSDVSVHNQEINFIISLAIMMIFTLVFYRILFTGERNIYFVLLLGLICGTFFSSLSAFFEVLIDPDEFLIVQGRMFASFSNVASEMLGISLIVGFVGLVLIIKYLRFLNPIALGKDIAINLGVEYHSIVKKMMILVAVLVSISTALVGPITFLGLLVANICYELMNTYRHDTLLLSGVLVAIIVLVGGIFIVSRVFDFNTTISVVVNFIGGIYFIFLVLRGNRL